MTEVFSPAKRKQGSDPCLCDENSVTDRAPFGACVPLTPRFPYSIDALHSSMVKSGCCAVKRLRVTGPYDGSMLSTMRLPPPSPRALSTAIFLPSPSSSTSEFCPTSYVPESPHLKPLSPQIARRQLWNSCPPPSSCPPLKVTPSFRDQRQAPLRKLTDNILSTYNSITETHRVFKRRVALEEAKAAEFQVNIGEVLSGRYIIEKLLGKGSFGQVLKAQDLRVNAYVAIKVTKKRKSFFAQAQSEVNTLQSILRADIDNRYHMVRMLDHFSHDGHMCIVFELLSYSLWDLIKNTNCEGVSLNIVKKVGRQVLETLAFLSLPSINIVHCDLKPENILFRNLRNCEVKVIDFGSSRRKNEKMHMYIQSRYYRAPEVLLRLPYNVAIDMWSLGCILCELHTGVPLFPGTSEADLMVKIIQVLGLPPLYMLNRSKRSHEFFKRDHFGSWSPRLFVPSSPTPLVMTPRSLSDILGVYTGGPKGKCLGLTGHDLGDYCRFQDLLVHMLAYDPEHRCTPLQALQHPFFTYVDDQHPASRTVTPVMTSSMTSSMLSSSSSYVAPYANGFHTNVPYAP